MGESKLLWFLPLKLNIGRPVGNGLNWESECKEQDAMVEELNQCSVYSSNAYNSKNLGSNSLIGNNKHNKSVNSLYRQDDRSRSANPIKP